VNARDITQIGILFSLVVALAAAEHMIPVFPFLPPGVKPGFSHIIIMYCVFYLGRKRALLLALLKSAFVLIIRGPIAAALSISGGLLSLVLLFMFISVFPGISCVAAAVSGAVVHNIGQITVYSLLVRVNMVFFYLPALIISGIAAGILTGTLLHKTVPLLHRTGRNEDG
jgi:heptaprenyl diphosphate synthase